MFLRYAERVSGNDRKGLELQGESPEETHQILGVFGTVTQG